MVRTLILALMIAVTSFAHARAAEVQRVVSPGGIEAWLVEDHSLPLVAMEFSFAGGSAGEPPAKAGLAEMTAALLTEGAGDLDSQAFHTRLEDLAVELTFTAGRDRFSGTLRTLTRHRDQAFDLVHLALTAPRFDAGDVERVRAQFLAGLRRAASDPNTIARRVWWRAMFPDQAYGKVARGTPDSLQAISRTDLRHFADSHFARDGLYVGVAGDITPEELARALDGLFGALPEESGAPEIGPQHPRSDGATMVVDMAVPQSVALFGQPGIAYDDPDFFAAYVLNDILGGGGFSSRLTEEVRVQRGLAYSVGSHLVPLEHGQVILGSVATANDRVAESLDLVRQEWQRIRQDGVTQAELDDAKTYLTGSFPLRFDRSTRIAGMLVAMQVHDWGIDYLDKRNSLVEAVTRDDVNRVAQRLLDPDALTVVVVGEPRDVTPTAKAPSPEL